MDESNGILVPMHGILPFSKANEHPMADFGHPETRLWSSFGAPGAPEMHNDALVFQRKSEVSKILGHKTAVYVHSNGI